MTTDTAEHHPAQVEALEKALHKCLFAFISVQTAVHNAVQDREGQFDREMLVDIYEAMAEANRALDWSPPRS